MKTKEFISKLNGIPNTESFMRISGIDVYNSEGKMVGWVSTNEFGVVNTSFKELDDMDNKNKTVKLLFEYALTSLSEREDELKFRIRMLPEEINSDTYLNQDKDSKNIFLSDLDETDTTQTIFTKSEYDRLQQKYHGWLPKFDKNDKHFEIIAEENSSK